jgi:hypothetical protein
VSGGSGNDGFLQRWARRKEQVRRGLAEAEPAPAPVAPQPAVPPPLAEPASGAVPAALDPAAVPREGSEAAEAPPPRPTMDDVARLTRDSDYSRFVGAGVDADVSNAAMRKLFSDPAFNVMDGLDTYIDDYGKPDPIPESMLRQLNQSKVLRLFEVEEDAAEKAAAAAAAGASPDGVASPAVAQSVSAPVPPPPPDDDPDLRLQQDDAPGRSGSAPGSRA